MPFNELVAAFGHDNIRSVKVPMGYSLTLWEHYLYEGMSKTLQGSEDEWGNQSCQKTGELAGLASSLTYSPL